MQNFIAGAPDMYSAGQLSSRLPPQHIHTDNDVAIAGATRNTRSSHMVSDIIHYTQLNVQHSRAGTANPCKGIADLDMAIVFVQEPWINKEKILGFGTSGATLHRDSNDVGPRSCILTKGLVAYSLPQETLLLYVLLVRCINANDEL